MKRVRALRLVTTPDQLSSNRSNSMSETREQYPSKLGLIRAFGLET